MTLPWQSWKMTRLTVFSHAATYERASGAKFNLKKCEDLWIGTNKDRTDKPQGIKWHTDKIKIIGFYLGNDNVKRANWEPRITCFKKTLNLWKTRCHTRTLGHSSTWSVEGKFQESWVKSLECRNPCYTSVTIWLFEKITPHSLQTYAVISNLPPVPTGKFSHWKICGNPSANSEKAVGNFQKVVGKSSQTPGEFP